MLSVAIKWTKKKKAAVAATGIGLLLLLFWPRPSKAAPPPPPPPPPPGSNITGSGTVSNFLKVSNITYTVRACLSADINLNATYLLVTQLFAPDDGVVITQNIYLAGRVPAGECAILGPFVWAAGFATFPGMPGGTYSARFYIVGTFSPNNPSTYQRISPVYDTDPFTIQGPALQPLSIGVSASPTTAPLGLPILFVALVSGGVPFYVYSWDFGDGTPIISETKNVTDSVQTHLYQNTGTYQVRVTVTDWGGQGLTASATVIVTVT